MWITAGDRSERDGHLGPGGPAGYTTDSDLHPRWGVDGRHQRGGRRVLAAIHRNGLVCRECGLQRGTGQNGTGIWVRGGRQDTQPTVIFIHGGGWTGGTKEAGAGFWLPYIEMGWNVVNVDYRVARIAPAPAAVEDCLCALRWIAPAPAA